MEGPGQCLLGKTETINTGELKDKGSKTVKVDPITVFHAPTLRSGGLLAVNDKFICYNVNSKGMSEEILILTCVKVPWLE